MCSINPWSSALAFGLRPLFGSSLDLLHSMSATAEVSPGAHAAPAQSLFWKTPAAGTDSKPGPLQPTKRGSGFGRPQLLGRTPNPDPCNQPNEDQASEFEANVVGLPLLMHQGALIKRHAFNLKLLSKAHPLGGRPKRRNIFCWVESSGCSRTKAGLGSSARWLIRLATATQQQDYGVSTCRHFSVLRPPDRTGSNPQQTLHSFLSISPSPHCRGLTPLLSLQDT